MLRAGVSTACLYPRVVEEALYDLALPTWKSSSTVTPNYAAALWIRWHGCYSGLT
jgi:hypothetical protein